MKNNKLELARLRVHLAVLYDVAKTYRGRTIDNIIQNYEARLQFFVERGGAE